MLGPSCPAKPQEQGWVLSAAGMYGQVVTHEEKPDRDGSNDTNIFKSSGAFAIGPPHIKKRLNQVCTKYIHSNIYSLCVCAYAKIFSLLRHETNSVVLPVNPISKFYLTR